MWDPKREPLDQCTTAEKFAKYANGGSLSMCQIESVAFGINQCHHSDEEENCLVKGLKIASFCMILILLYPFKENLYTL